MCSCQGVYFVLAQTSDSNLNWLYVRVRLPPRLGHWCRYYNLAAWEYQEAVKKQKKMLKSNKGANLTDEELRRHVQHAYPCT